MDPTNWCMFPNNFPEKSAQFDWDAVHGPAIFRTTLYPVGAAEKAGILHWCAIACSQSHKHKQTYTHFLSKSFFFSLSFIFLFVFYEWVHVNNSSANILDYTANSQVVEKWKCMRNAKPHLKPWNICPSISARAHHPSGRLRLRERTHWLNAKYRHEYQEDLWRS